VTHERARELAAVQLERVRSQMGEVYRPVHARMVQADTCAIYMARALGFQWADIFDWEFVQPFALWPELEVLNRNHSPKAFAGIKSSPYRKYSLADIAVLEDPAKRQVYIEAHGGCIVPRWREIAAILSTKTALMEPPPPSYLDGVFPADGLDWTKFSGGTLSYHMFDMAAFVYAWAPLERRWEAGGASALSRTRITLAIEHVDPTRRLLADAASAAKPVAHRTNDFHQDDRRDWREGSRAPGLLERRPPERGDRDHER
jgi:hypothetical protein